MIQKGDIEHDMVPSTRQNGSGSHAADVLGPCTVEAGIHPGLYQQESRPRLYLMKWDVSDKL